MTTPYVIVLGWTAPNTGAQQVFGPYSGRERAEEAMAILKSWPALSMVCGDFEVVECTHFELPTPWVAPPEIFKPNPHQFWPHTTPPTIISSPRSV